MTNKYRAEQYISISASESGEEVELLMVVNFTVNPGSKATMIDPAEMPLAEAGEIQFFGIKNGKPDTTPLSLPVWFWRHFTEGEAFQDWMLSEAAEQHIAAKEDYADQRREMMQEELI